MPPYPQHLKTSAQRTNNDYQPLHDWLDNHPDHKAARHDRPLLPTTGSMSERTGAKRP